jgi:hypothetical protein
MELAGTTVRAGKEEAEIKVGLHWQEREEGLEVALKVSAHAPHA